MDLELDLDKILKAKSNGIVIPYTTMQVSRETGVPFYALCAFLVQESGGGKNIFGHDPTIFIGAGTVTKAKYLDYKKQRDANKTHRKMQGVGPMQLTYYTYQDQADALGGCWEPYYNVTVGAKFIQSLRDKYGQYNWVAVGEHYNGAHSYGVTIDKRIASWKKIILG